MKFVDGLWVKNPKDLSKKWEWDLRQNREGHCFLMQDENLEGAHALRGSSDRILIPCMKDGTYLRHNDYIVTEVIFGNYRCLSYNQIRKESEERARARGEIL